MFFYNFLLGVHLLLTITLILVILLQTGKGAEIGAVFGGGGAVFGSMGAATFLHKLTIGLAAVFMATSLILAIIAPRSQATIFKPIAETAAPAAAPAEVPASGVPAAGGEQAAPADAEATAPQQTTTAPAVDTAAPPTTESAGQ